MKEDSIKKHLAECVSAGLIVPYTVELIRAALPNRAPATAPECPRCGPKAIEQARRIIEAMDAED